MKRPKRKKKSRFKTGKYTSNKTNIEWSYRSGWELAFMRYLDNEPTVSSWSYEIIKICYVSNKKSRRVRTYIPDFWIEYVDGQKQIVEIKQQRMLERPNVKRKKAAAQEWCAENNMTFNILTEIQLKELKII